MKSRPHAVPLPRRRDQWRTLTAHWCCEHTSAQPASSLAKTTQASRGPGRTESPRWSPRCTGPVPGAGSARQGPLFNVPKPWDGVSDCHDVPDPRTTVRRRRRLWGGGRQSGLPTRECVLEDTAWGGPAEGPPTLCHSRTDLCHLAPRIQTQREFFQHFPFYFLEEKN